MKAFDLNGAVLDVSVGQAVVGTGFRAVAIFSEDVANPEFIEWFTQYVCGRLVPGAAIGENT